MGEPSSPSPNVGPGGLHVGGAHLRRSHTPYRQGALEGARMEGTVPLAVRHGSLPRLPHVGKLPPVTLGSIGRNMSLPALNLDRLKASVALRGSLGSLRPGSGKIRLAPLVNPKKSSVDESLTVTELLLRRLQVTKQRYLRVFLSSTFRGMEEERECLTKKYFKELRHQCEQAGIFLTIVDLRWGITDVAAKNAETLLICLREIDDSDIFLGFYGERYGWHQAMHAPVDELLQKNFDKMAQKYPWTAEYRDRSATEIEFLHGHINNPRARPSLFFFRDPKWDELSCATAPEEEKFKFQAENPQAKRKLDALKDRVRASREAQVFDNYMDPEDGALKMFMALRELLNEVIEKSGLANNDSDAALHEAFMLSRAQVYVGGDKYIATIDAHFAQNNAKPLVVSGLPGIGKSSLLANWILKHYPNGQVGENECLVYHFIGSSEPSTRPDNILRRLASGIAKSLAVMDPLPLEIERLKDKVCEYLFLAASRGIRVTFVLDALDQLENRDGALDLRWLPDSRVWSQVRFLVSLSTPPPIPPPSAGTPAPVPLGTNPLVPMHNIAEVEGSSANISQPTPAADGEPPVQPRPPSQPSTSASGSRQNSGRRASASASGADADKAAAPPLHKMNSGTRIGALGTTLHATMQDLSLSEERRCWDAVDRKGWTDRLEVMPWIPDEVAVFVRTVLKRAGKSLSETRKDPGTPSQMETIVNARQCCNPLYVSLLMEELCAFGDFDELDAQIAQCLQCQDPVALFQHVLKEVEREHAVGERNIIQDVLVCLAVARYGLSEMEILDILGIEQSLWSPIFYARRNFFVKRSGLLGFIHKQLRSAVEQRYLTGKESGRVLARMMANYFAAKLDQWVAGPQDAPVEQRVVDELPWLLEFVDDKEGMKACLSNLSVFQQMFDREKYELFTYWRFVGADGAEIASCYKASLEKVRDPMSLSVLYGLVGRFVHEFGFMNAAFPFFEAELDISEKLYSAEHPNVAMALNNLAGLYKDQGEFNHALPLYERALKIYESTYGNNHQDVAAAINNLALLYSAHGQYNNALPLYERSLRIRETVLGDDHPDVAISLNNLAGIYFYQGHYDKALPLYERSLAIRKAKFGDEHPNVATALNNLAELYKAQALYDKAQLLYEQSLAIRESKFGDSHPSVATAMNNLALLYTARGHFRKAQPLFERSLHIREAQLGMDHPDVAMSLNNLASLFRSQNNSSKAMPLYRRSLAIYEARFGPDHPTVATALNNIAELYSAEGQHDKAIPLYQRAAVIYESKFDENHPDLASTLNNLATTYDEQGQYEKAVPLYERALKIYEIKFGPDHPDVAMTLNNLAMLHEDRGEEDLAIRLYERSLAIRERNFGHDHPEVAESLHNLATVLATKKEWLRVVKLLERAVAIRRQRFGPDHESTQASMELYAEACLHERSGETGMVAAAVPLSRPPKPRKPADDGTIDASAITATGEIVSSADGDDE